MVFLENLLRKNDAVILYNTDVYVMENSPDFGKSKFNDKNPSLFRKNDHEHKLGKLSSVETAFHKSEGNFSNLNVFVNKVLVPNLQSSITQGIKRLNLYFDDICSRNFPLILTKNDIWRYKKQEVASQYTPSKSHFIFNGNCFFESERLPFSSVINYIKKENSAFNSKRPKNKIRVESLDRDKGYASIFNSNGFRVFREYNPFRIEHEGNLYIFDPVEVSIDIRKNRSGIKITEPLAPKGYKHPFVYTTGDICFDGEFRWKAKGVDFDSYKNLNCDLSHEVVKIFQEVFNNFKNGYNPGNNPVRDLNPSNFPEAKRKGDQYGR